MIKETHLHPDESRVDSGEKSGNPQQGRQSVNLKQGCESHAKISDPKSDKPKGADGRQSNQKSWRAVNKATGPAPQFKQPKRPMREGQPDSSDTPKQSEPGIIKQYGLYFGAGALLLIAIAGLSHNMTGSHLAQNAPLVKTGQDSPIERLSALQRQGGLTDFSVIESLKRKLTTLSQQFEKQADGIEDKVVILNSLQGINSRLSQQESEQASQMRQLENKLDAQYRGIQSNLSHIQDLVQTQPSHVPASSSQYLNPSQLPFKVVSIDAIQGRAVVSVAYNHTILPLEKDTSLAGWRLTQANFTEQSAVFSEQSATFIPTGEHIKPRQIKVSLNMPVASGQLPKSK